MKMKSLISLAVAAFIAAPVAMAGDATIYGRVNNALIRTTGAGNASSWDMKDGNSRFGAKGSEDLGNGLTAIYQWELEINTAEASNGDNHYNRVGYVGLSGDFGTVTAGRQWIPHFFTVEQAADFQVGGFDAFYLGPFREGNAVAYVSPGFNGLSMTLAAVMDGGSRDVGNTGTVEVTASDSSTSSQSYSYDSSAESASGADVVNVTLNYKNGPITLGISSLRFKEANDPNYNDLLGIGAAYTTDSFRIGGQYEKGDVVDPAANDVKSWGLGTELYFGSNTLRATVGNNEQSTVGDPKLDHWAVEVQHAFSKRTKLFAAYGSNESGSLAESTKTFGVGLRHDF